MVWLSLPHLVYNSARSLTATLWLLSWLSYIIVQRPLSHLLDFWNRMLDRHQAEITVMQFTGHSLPVHQSMSVPWEFFTSSHFINQFPPTRFPLITAIRMCHFLPVHHLGMTFLAGPKSEIQHFSLSFIASGRSSGLHLVSSHSCRMYVWAGRPAFARPYVGVHRSTSLISSSLLLQKCLEKSRQIISKYPNRQRYGTKRINLWRGETSLG